MGLVYAQIRLTNADDIALSKRNYIKKDEIRYIDVNAMVDSGAYMLAINESIKIQLGLDVIANIYAPLSTIAFALMYRISSFVM